MSKGLTQAHIEAFKVRLEAARRANERRPVHFDDDDERAGLPAVDLGRVGVAYWRDRSRRAEAAQRRAEARLDGVLSALTALGLDGLVLQTAESADARPDE